MVPYTIIATCELHMNITTIKLETYCQIVLLRLILINQSGNALNSSPISNLTKRHNFNNMKI